MRKQNIYFLGAVDRKNGTQMVTRKYTELAGFTGISLYKLHKYSSKAPIYEDDNFIICFEMLYCSGRT